MVFKNNIIYNNDNIEIYKFAASLFQCYHNIFTSNEFLHFSKYNGIRKKLSKMSIYFLKLIVSYKLDVVLDSIEISYLNIKPQIIIDNKNIDYECSVSHIGDVVYISLSRKVHGIDVMETSMDINKKRYSLFKNTKITSKNEFLKCWTRREAFIKCLGLRKFESFSNIDFTKNTIKSDRYMYKFNTFLIYKHIISYSYREDKNEKHI